MSSVNSYNTGGDFYGNLALIGRAFTDEMQEHLDQEIADHEQPDPPPQQANKAPAKPAAPAASLLAGASTLKRAATGELPSLPFESTPSTASTAAKAATPSAPQMPAESFSEGSQPTAMQTGNGPSTAAPGSSGAPPSRAPMPAAMNPGNATPTSSVVNRSSPSVSSLPAQPQAATSRPSVSTSAGTTASTSSAGTPAPSGASDVMDFASFAEPETATPEEKYAALPATQKAQFDAIAKAIAPAAPGTPATRALPSLALPGRAQATPAPAGQALPAQLGRLLAAGQFEGAQGDHLLAALSQLASGKLAPSLAGSLSNARLVQETLDQIENPLAVRQSAAQLTSGEASLERLVIETDPALYVETLANLAGEAQVATLPNGRTLGLPPGVTHLSEEASAVSALFQNALHDAFTEGGSQPLGKAAFNSQLAALLPESDAKLVAFFEVGQQARASSALQRGDIAIIDGLPGSNAKQAVTILAKDLKNVSFVDPDGNAVTVPMSEFVARLRGAVLSARAEVADETSAWEIGNDPGWIHFDPQSPQQPRSAKAPKKKASIWGAASKRGQEEDDEAGPEGDDLPWYFIRRVER